VTLNVLQRIDGRRWTVALGDRTFTASSSLDLEPGRAVRARVDLQGERLVLRLIDPPRRPADGAPPPAWRGPAPLASPPWRPAPDGPEEAARRIVSALLNSRIAVNPQTIGRVERTLARWSAERPGGEGEKRLLRLIAMMLDRRLDPDAPGFYRILALLSGEEGSRGDGRRDRRRRPGSGGEPGGQDTGEKGIGPAVPPEAAEPSAREVAGLLKDAVLRGSLDGESPLQVFNHCRAEHETWIVLPFRLQGGALLTGSLRILYDPLLREAKRFVLEAGAEDGIRWTFLLGREAGRLRLRTVCSDPGYLVPGAPARPGGQEGISRLQIKLRNLGVEVDDTIHGCGDFDGFSLPAEQLLCRSVDIVQ
jgi:hypothetical protein